MLCKTSVARSVFGELVRQQIPIKSCDILEFDAKKVFKINASACVLVIQLTPEATEDNLAKHCTIANFANPSLALARLHYQNGQLKQTKLTNTTENSNPQPAGPAYDFDGECCFQWRQGIKHDCAKVMELSLVNGKYYNGWQEEVEIEAELVYPLVKSSMFKHALLNTYQKFVIVPQQKIKQDTAWIQKALPKTWQYLTSKAEYFTQRKSSIYRNSPNFAVFGVGDYSFAPYKVGVSGFYKKPLFSLLLPIVGTEVKPAMTDDTCYFLSFAEQEQAYCAMLLLNSKQVQDFLQEIAFLDSKRPYSKKILARLDFSKIIRLIRLEYLVQTEVELELEPKISAEIYEQFKLLVLGQTSE